MAEKQRASGILRHEEILHRDRRRPVLRDDRGDAVVDAVQPPREREGCLGADAAVVDVADGIPIPLAITDIRTP